ncbi:MAG TPA: MmgE/PrpD family protein [Dehalococcoidia bacterium]|nr:MmgE/PrpD family protein [Dehalococcoidia bacterium]
MTMTITEKWADFLSTFTYDDIPAEVVHQSKLHILDSIGCVLGGYAIDWGKKVTSLGRDLGGKPEATVIGSGDRLHCANAAYVNGKLSNVLDMDETLYQTRHIGGVPFFSALSVGERAGATGRDVILATVLAYDFGARCALCGSIWRPDPERGVVSSIYGSSGFNTLAASIAAAKIMKFDNQQIANTIGVAAYLAPGAIESKFSFTPPANFNKSADMGWFCLGGITAALCAKNGYVGDPSILDGPRGIMALLGALEFDNDTFLEKLGERWYIMDAGFKPYPTCRWFHNGIGLLEGILNKHDIKPEDIEKIIVNTHPLGITLPTYVAADKWAESTNRDLWFSQFSFAYALACTVYRILPGPEWAKEKTLNDPGIAEMTRKITHGEHPDAVRMAANWSGHPGRLFSQPPVSIEVFSSKGHFTAESTDIPGDSWNPRVRLADTAIIDKFRNNASYVLEDTQINRIIEGVEELDRMKEISALAQLLAP